jgi:membrane associated rhomboid family serine protease
MMNPYTKNPADELKSFFRERSILSSLILVNIGFWLLVKIANVLFFLFQHPGPNPANIWFLHFFAIPASMPSLGLVPWTIFTYMFLHFDFWHILFNMFWLFWFGKIFVEFLKPLQLLQTYIFGGLAGAFFYVASYNLFPVFQPYLPISYALGASASIMAIVTAISFYVPGYSINLLFLGRVKILYIAIILFIFDFFAIPGDNSGGHIAHIGGALWGFVYVLVAKNRSGNLFSGNLPGWLKNMVSIFSRSGNKTASFSKNGSRPLTDEEYNLQKKEHQQRIDEILEKISKGGYESLSKSEKEILFKSSRKDK